MAEVCLKCKGKLKNAPLARLEMIKGFNPSPLHPHEYSNGTVLDPLSCNVYKGKAKLSANGKRLTMRGSIGVYALGRSTAWFRND